MENLLLKYISKFNSITEEEQKSIVESIPVKIFKKDEILLREGEVSKECYFVLQGCVRQYFYDNGVEKTTNFFTEEQAVVSFKSYSQQIPSDHYLVCVEDSTLIVGQFGNEQEMYKRFPKLESLTRELMKKDFGNTQDDFASFITSSPEERYLKILESRPDLLNRVPQHQIASYIGIKPESLSRIRKRIFLKK